MELARPEERLDEERLEDEPLDCDRGLERWRLSDFGLVEVLRLRLDCLLLLLEDVFFSVWAGAVLNLRTVTDLSPTLRTVLSSTASLRRTTRAVFLRNSAMENLLKGHRI